MADFNTDLWAKALSPDDPYAGTGLAQFRKATGQNPVTEAPSAEPQTALDFIVRGLGQGMIDLPKQAREESWKAYEGDPSYNPAPAMSMALGAAGSGMPFAEAGAAGIFGGRLAKGADLRAWSKAQDMADSVARSLKKVNAPPDLAHEIINRSTWNETGWFRGPEGKWRFKIPDVGAEYTGRAPMLPEKLPLSEVLHHPEAYQNYPSLGKIDVTEEIRPGFSGTFDFGENRMTLDPAEILNKEPPVTTLHELQHGVQNIEGFPAGSSQEWVKKNFMQAVHDPTHPFHNDPAVARVREVVNNPGQPEPPDLVRNFNRAMYQAYQREPGEVEARNVEAQYLRDKAGYPTGRPWETQDVFASEAAKFLPNTYLERHPREVREYVRALSGQ